MTPFTEHFTNTLSLLTLLGLILTIILFFVRFIYGAQLRENLYKLISPCAYPLVFFVTIFGIVGSMFYSNIFGFTPCTLCWWARILLYPQAIIMLIAISFKDALAKTYSLALSFIGLLVTGYHSYLQLGGISLFPCSTNPNGSGGCEIRYFLEFGFITLPAMGFVAFLLIITLLLYKR